jgi:hypothetical protein
MWRGTYRLQKPADRSRVVLYGGAILSFTPILAASKGALRASITSERLRSIHSDGVIAVPKQYGYKKFIFLKPITIFVPVDGTPKGVWIILPHVPHTAGMGTCVVGVSHPATVVDSVPGSALEGTSGA